MRRFNYPVEGAGEIWVDLPDVWLGKHVLRRDQALARIKESDQESPLFTRFAVSMALLEDWKLPGLGSNPENWDLEKMNLTVMVWVADTVLGDFGKALIVPKAPSTPSQTG